MSAIARLAYLPLAAALLTMASRSQDAGTLPDFRVDMTFAGGVASHDTDQSNLDGDTGAGYFRLQFEGFGHEDFGGGIRLEGWKTKDDLFDDNGFPGIEATTSSLFLHGSLRFTDGGLRMPLRAGFLFNDHVLEDTSTHEQTTYSSFGPQAEIAPELFLSRRSNFAWSVYGELGLGIAFTSIEVDGTPGSFDSTTWLYGIELGTRAYLGSIEVGLSYIARGQMMSESDPNGSTVVHAYESSFDGLALTMGVVF